ncbi:MAG TPA: serine hydrolase, partial [Thermomicrobiales bacterium]|nr:serine hydrolase [Thermomicrobiales bacterium]
SHVISTELSSLIAGFDGEAAYLARNFETGQEVGYRAERGMPTASTIKIVVLAELFRQVDAGAVDLDAQVEMLAEDRRGGSGILKDLSDGVIATVRDHATLMIALSDNTSTALLVRLLGRERILQSAREWGMTDTSAGFDRVEGDGARGYAASTPRDLVHLLGLIATDAIISPAACRVMRDILGTQQYHEQIARMLPFHQFAREGNVHSGPLVVRSKSGFMADDSGAVRVDAGIVEIADGPRWVIALMTEGHPDRRFHPEHPGMVLNGRISRIVYDAWAGDAA